MFLFTCDVPAAITRFVDRGELILNFAERVAHRLEQRVGIVEEVLAVLTQGFVREGRECFAHLHLRVLQQRFLLAGGPFSRAQRSLQRRAFSREPRLARHHHGGDHGTARQRAHDSCDEVFPHQQRLYASV